MAQKAKTSLWSCSSEENVFPQGIDVVICLMKGGRRLCIKESPREMIEKKKVNAAEAAGVVFSGGQ